MIAIVPYPILELNTTLIITHDGRKDKPASDKHAGQPDKSHDAINTMSGALIADGPTWMQVMAHFDPLYYVVEGARSLGSGDFSSDHVWQALAVIIPLSVMVLIWATNLFKKAVA
jgi:hypothetical protein